MSLKTNIAKITASEPSLWINQAKSRGIGRALRRDMLEVSLIVLETLSDNKITQKDLAARMGVTPQQVNKLLKEPQNLTFETVHKLQDALGMRFMHIERPTKYNRLTSAMMTIHTQVVAEMWREKEIGTIVQRHITKCVTNTNATDTQTILKVMQPCLS